MDNLFYLSPSSFDFSHLPPNPKSITIRRASGETLSLDPGQNKVSLTSEHPQVDNMSGDWGAICEVFRDSNTYYASITGVRLDAGDLIMLDYPTGYGFITLKVIDIENGRARTDPPHITPSGGQQNP